MIERAEGLQQKGASLPSCGRGGRAAGAGLAGGCGWEGNEGYKSAN